MSLHSAARTAGTVATVLSLLPLLISAELAVIDAVQDPPARRAAVPAATAEAPPAVQGR